MIKSAGFILLTAMVLLGAGCTQLSSNKVEEKKIAPTPVGGNSLTICGEFPRSTGDGGPTSRYSVCRNAKSDTCYLKTVYSKQISGCDPKLSDQNPYGDEKCFEYLTDAFDFTGKKLITGAKEFQLGDNCELTTEEFYKSKVK